MKKVIKENLMAVSVVGILIIVFTIAVYHA